MESEDEQDTPEEIALYQAVAGAMKAGRLNLGLSHAEFAARAGMKKPYIIGLERGTANPTLRTILRVATAIGVDPVELLPGATRPGLQPSQIEPLIQACEALETLAADRKHHLEEMVERELHALRSLKDAIQSLAPLHKTVPIPHDHHVVGDPSEADDRKAPEGGYKKVSGPSRQVTKK